MLCGAQMHTTTWIANDGFSHFHVSFVVTQFAYAAIPTYYSGKQPFLAPLSDIGSSVKYSIDIR